MKTPHPNPSLFQVRVTPDGGRSRVHGFYNMAIALRFAMAQQELHGNRVVIQTLKRPAPALADAIAYGN